uniref:Nucleolus and neural progenitor protein-like N-terminal domain-containing protein n=1 Tax=Amphimedon queenslandica TaxID=400682 RepID=A0A1X7T4N1_AMPQE
MEEPIGSWVFPRLSLTLASKEMVYFSKWIYRHRSRLRKDKSFQRLLQIERLIKRYLKINITNLAKQALKEINSSGRIVSSTQLISFMTQLSDCTLYVIQLLKLMESTFNDLYQRIETCHLLYAYIIVTSSLSRLWFYLKRHVWVLCEIQSRLFIKESKSFGTNNVIE